MDEEQEDEVPLSKVRRVEQIDFEDMSLHVQKKLNGFSFFRVVMQNGRRLEFGCPDKKESSAWVSAIKSRFLKN